MLENCMKIVKLVILVVGLISSVVLVWLVMVDELEIWDVFNSLIGLMGGLMIGLFMLGIFFKWVNVGSVVLGIIISVIIVLGVCYVIDFNFFFYGVIGLLSVVISGVIFVLLFVLVLLLMLDEKFELKVILWFYDIMLYWYSIWWC